jgi:hypothetical protein
MLTIVGIDVNGFGKVIVIIARSLESKTVFVCTHLQRTLKSERYVFFPPTFRGLQKIE